MSSEMEPYENENAFTYEQYENELTQYYPDIYKIVYPMVCKACLYITEDITEELVERITNEIYENVENNEEPEESRFVRENYNNIQQYRNNRYMNRNINLRNETSTDEKRQKNFLLNDLIKILVLRELIGKGRRPQRPFPYIPGRPRI